jgi:hypothetical protein
MMTVAAYYFNACILRRRTMLLVALLTACTARSAQPKQFHIGEIDFFGTEGVDVQKVWSLLPVRRRNKLFESQDSHIQEQINAAVKRALGHPPTEVDFMCCDTQGGLMIFIGLGGKNSTIIRAHRAPEDSGCLPKRAVTLYQDAMAALLPAIQKGNSGEDDSRGYSLSNDPVLRSKQMAMREYAMAHEQSLERTLRTCGTPQDRRAAAEMLGYGQTSARQIGALVYASRDPDSGVRNNAIRALYVLAMASPKTASQIPAASFIEMLNSGAWEDRNKAGLLLMALTLSRNPQLLHQLSTEALPSLIEMARWRNPDHAYPYRVMLGRIAGCSEVRIQQLVANTKSDEIIAAAKDKRLSRPK